MLQKAALFPQTWTPALERAIPAAETRLALLLVTPVARPLTLLFTFLVSACFAGLHTCLIGSDEVVRCGCMGITMQFDPAESHAVFVGLAGLMALAAAWLLWRAAAPDAGSNGHAD